MGEVSIIGVDLAKNVFQMHSASADGSVLFGKKLPGAQFARFMAAQTTLPNEGLACRRPT
jgi:hypothetical protein